MHERVSPGLKLDLVQAEFISVKIQLLTLNFYSEQLDNFIDSNVKFKNNTEQCGQM